MADEDAQMLEIGKHCSEPSCNQLDFLPFSCGYCRRTFCADHWKVERGHRCAAAEAADNRIDVPNCPLCESPVPVERDQDPNVPCIISQRRHMNTKSHQVHRMDRHFTTSCPILDPRNGLARPTATVGAAKAKSPDLCAASRCQTRLIAVRITCQSCGRDFCAKHRMSRDHACSPVKAAPPALPVRRPLATKLSTKLSSPSNSVEATPALAAKAASTPSTQPGLAALRRAKVAASERLQAMGNSKADAIDLDEEPVAAAASKPKPKPLSAAARRDRQERANVIKSLEGRAAKGLLNDEQKLELATLKAKSKREGPLKRTIFDLD